MNAVPLSISSHHAPLGRLSSFSSLVRPFLIRLATSRCSSAITARSLMLPPPPDLDAHAALAASR